MKYWQPDNNITERSKTKIAFWFLSIFAFYHVAFGPVQHSIFVVCICVTSLYDMHKRLLRLAAVMAMAVVVLCYYLYFSILDCAVREKERVINKNTRYDLQNKGIIDVSMVFPLSFVQSLASPVVFSIHFIVYCSLEFSFELYHSFLFVIWHRFYSAHVAICN